MSLRRIQERIRLAKRLKSFKRLRLIPRSCDFGISSTFDAVLRYLPIFCGITVFVDIFCGIAVFGTPQCPPPEQDYDSRTSLHDHLPVFSICLNSDNEPVKACSEAAFVRDKSSANYNMGKFLENLENVNLSSRNADPQLCK